MKEADSRGHRNQARRRAILEATIRIVGAKGPRAVTHRAVAAEAHVPLAATTYYFASREELLEEALRYAGTRDAREMQRLANGLSPGDLSASTLAAILSRYVAKQLETRRSTILAQYELLLESARSPRLRKATRQDLDSFLLVTEPLLGAAGSRQPGRDAQLLVATLDGLLLIQLSMPKKNFERAVLLPALERLVRALVHPATETIAQV